MSDARDEQMMQALRQRPTIKPGLLIGVGVVVALVVAVAVVAVSAGGGKANRHFSALSRCLIGEPVKEGENVFLRLREVELAEQLRPSAEGEGWPARCAPHASELYRSLDGSGKEALLARLLRSELSCGDDETAPCQFPTEGHPFGKADEVWEAARIAGVAIVDVPDVAAPAHRLAPALRRDLPALASAKHYLADSGVTPSGQAWLVYGARRGSELPMRLCRVTERGKSADCSDVKSPTASGELTLLDLSEPPAVVGNFPGEDGDERGAVSLLDGTRLKLRAGMRKGHVLEPRGKELFLVEIDGGAAVAQAKLELDPTTQATMVAGQFGYLHEQDGERKLSWRRIGAGAVLEGEPVTLAGTIPARVDVCEATPTSGVAHGLQGEERVVWFVDGGAWSPPVKGRVPRVRTNEWGPDCRPARYLRHWVERDEGGFRVGRLDCSPKGCKSDAVAFTEKRIKRFLAVTSFDDRVAVVYETHAGGLRSRVAPLGSLDAQPPALIMDSFEFSGEKLENPRVTVAPDHVILTFDNEKHQLAIVVSADAHGAVTPK